LNPYVLQKAQNLKSIFCK